MAFSDEFTVIDDLPGEGWDMKPGGKPVPLNFDDKKQCPCCHKKTLVTNARVWTLHGSNALYQTGETTLTCPCGYQSTVTTETCTPRHGKEESTSKESGS